MEGAVSRNYGYEGRSSCKCDVECLMEEAWDHTDDLWNRTVYGILTRIPSTFVLARMAGLLPERSTLVSTSVPPAQHRVTHANQFEWTFPSATTLPSPGLWPSSSDPGTHGGRSRKLWWRILVVGSGMDACALWNGSPSVRGVPYISFDRIRTQSLQLLPKLRHSLMQLGARSNLLAGCPLTFATSA